MSYQPFALKYRPQRFEEIVGQPHISQTLQNAVAEGRIVHGYLFAGPRGTGKTSTARVFAKAILRQAHLVFIAPDIFAHAEQARTLRILITPDILARAKLRHAELVLIPTNVLAHAELAGPLRVIISALVLAHAELRHTELVTITAPVFFHRVALRGVLVVELVARKLVLELCLPGLVAKLARRTCLAQKAALFLR